MDFDLRWNWIIKSILKNWNESQEQELLYRTSPQKKLQNPQCVYIFFHHLNGYEHCTSKFWASISGAMVNSPVEVGIFIFHSLRVLKKKHHPNGWFACLGLSDVHQQVGHSPKKVSPRNCWVCIRLQGFLSKVFGFARFGKKLKVATGFSQTK